MDVTMEPSVALIQLPVPDPEHGAKLTNVQLAAGYMKAYCVAAGGVSPASIRIIPRRIVDHGGDEAILSWVSSLRPDLVGFSCSMWNLRRSTRIAEMIKERMPGTLTMAGGPEIVSGQPVMESAAFDSLVEGEGEPALLEAMRDLEAGHGLRRRYGGAELLDLARVPNPYLFGAMEQRPDDTLYLETVRGCPHRCSYCFYGKAYPRVRLFPRHVLEAIFPWARSHEARQIYILDPSSDSLPDWEDRLRLYASLNEGGIAIHTEIHLESVATPERADLLYKAGVRSVEAGLQSTNDQALKVVHRSWDREPFLRGARLLRERGIRVTIGLILGLPEDTREGFAASVSFLADNGLQDAMNVLPLSVLPGTTLRAEASERNIRYMPEPPYMVLSTPTMSEDDLHNAFAGARGNMDGRAPIASPRFGGESDGLIEFLDLRGSATLPPPELLASSITILMGAAQVRTSLVEELGSRLISAVPSSVFHVVVESESPLGPEIEARVVRAFSIPQGESPARLFRLARTLPRDDGATEGADLVLRFSDSLLADEPSLQRQMPYLLLAGPLDQAANAALARVYKGREKKLISMHGPLR